MSNRQLLVTMRDGSVWAVPVWIIIRNRAEYYHTQRSDEYPTFAKANAETEDLFLDDNEVHDWASNNMNWSDVAAWARMVQALPPLTAADFREGWANGEHRIVTHEAPDAV